MKYRNFKESEIKGLVINFVMLLDDARDIAKVPFIINSGYRTPQHSIEVGGFADDAHTKGLAVDLKCNDSQTRYSIINALLKVGFCRIGDEEDHIHVDMDATKVQNVIFHK
jgi:zinc D-Ala-D-Ala carboxypeptidase